MWYCISTSLLKSSPPLGWDCRKNSKTDGKNKETEKKEKGNFSRGIYNAKISSKGISTDLQDKMLFYLKTQNGH